MSENDNPHFDIEFRQKEGESTIWGSALKYYANIDLYTIANEIYDFMYDDYEIWIKDTGKEKINNENVEYVISVIADNMFEDGLPLEHRLVNDQLVIWQSKDTSPFSKKASDYYEKHLDEKSLNDFSDKNP